MAKEKLDKVFYAKELKKNKLLEVIFDDIEADIVLRWKIAEDIKTREECFTRIQALEDIKAKIDGYINEYLIDNQK